MKSQWFGHSGDLGDVIYSLPTIKALGGGTLYLFNYPGRTTAPMTPERVNSMRPLLRVQPYIVDAVYWPNHSKDHALNGFRGHLARHGNLADAHLATHGLTWHHRSDAWLQVDQAHRVTPVVIHRSERYHNQAFPWKEIVKAYGSELTFLGARAEWEAFCAAVGPVEYHPTGDLLEVARIIAGSQLFIGNQSCPAAIAEGLKHPMISENTHGPSDNCRFERIGRINGYGGKLELPR